MSKNDIKIRVKVGSDTKQLTFTRKEVESLGKSIFHADKQTHSFTKRLRDMAHMSAAIWGIKQAFDGIVNITKTITNIPATFETMETTLRTLEGSGIKAKESMKWIEDFTSNTPFELEQVGNSFVKLKAYGIDPLDGTLRTLGDTASAMNKPIGDAVEALADAMNTEGERLKQFGIKQKVQGDQITYMYSSQGKQQAITIDNNRDVIKSTLESIWNDKYAGAMKDREQTFDGMQSNTSDAFTLLAKNISEQSGAFDLAKTVIKEIGDGAKALNNPETLEWIGEGAKTITILATSVGAAKLSFVLFNKTQATYNKLAPLFVASTSSQSASMSMLTTKTRLQIKATKILSVTSKTLSRSMKAVPFIAITSLAYSMVDSFVTSSISLDDLSTKFDKAAFAANNYSKEVAKHRLNTLGDTYIEARDEESSLRRERHSYKASHGYKTRGKEENEKIEEYDALIYEMRQKRFAIEDEMKALKDLLAGEPLIQAESNTNKEQKNLLSKREKMIEGSITKSLGHYENYYESIGDSAAVWSIKETEIRQDMEGFEHLDDYVATKEASFKLENGLLDEQVTKYEIYYKNLNTLELEQAEKSLKIKMALKKITAEEYAAQMEAIKNVRSEIENYKNDDVLGNIFSGWTDVVTKTAVDAIQDIYDNNYSFDKMVNSLTSALGSAFTQSGINALVKSNGATGWSGVAAGAGLALTSKLFGGKEKEQVWHSSAKDWETYKKEAESAKLAFYEATGDTLGALNYEYENSTESVDNLLSSVGDITVSLENYSDSFEEAIANGLTKEQIKEWEDLGDALEEAANAAKALREEELRSVGQHLSYEESLLELTELLNEANVDLYYSLKDLATSADDAIDALNLVGASDTQATDYYIKEYAALQSEIDGYFTNGVANAGDSDAISSAFDEMVALSGQIAGSGAYGETFADDLSTSLSHYQELFDFSAETMDVRIIEDLTDSDTEHLSASSYSVGSTLGTQETIDLIETASTDQNHLNIDSAQELFSSLQAFEVAGTSASDDIAYLENLAGINYGGVTDAATVANPDILTQLAQLDEAGMLSEDASAAYRAVDASVEEDTTRAEFVSQELADFKAMFDDGYFRYFSATGTTSYRDFVSSESEFNNMLKMLSTIGVPYANASWEYDTDYYSPSGYFNTKTSEADIYRKAVDYFDSQLTYFADGGIVNGPTLGMVGEVPGVSEAIIPLTSTDIMENLEGKTNRQLISLVSALINEFKELKPILAANNKLSVISKNLLADLLNQAENEITKVEMIV